MGINAEIDLTTIKSLTDAQISQINYRLVNCFAEAGDGEEMLCLGFSYEKYIKKELKTANAYHISTWGRYYSEGYERGAIWTYIGIAELLEYLIKDIKVYYRGDCSDNLVIFDAKRREELKKHYFKVGHDPYNNESFI